MIVINQGRYINKKNGLLIGLIALLPIVVLLFVRNRYSFCWSDESFYIALVHRLYLNGKPFIEEWNPAQFYSVLFVPLYYIYANWGGDEGIYLLARNFYVLLAFLSSYYVFYIFRTKLKLRIQYCIAASYFVMLYSWANVMGISYHNIFFLAMITALMLLISAIFDQDKKNRWQCMCVSILAGVFAGVGIITIPTAAIFIGILFFAFFYLYFVKRMYKGKIRVAISVAFGMILDAILYLGFVLSRVSVAELSVHIGYIFQDEDHKVKNLIGYLGNLASLLCGCGKYVLFLICTTICIRSFLFCRKKDIDLRVQDMLYFVSVPILIYSIYIYANSHMSTYIIFGLYGFFCMILFAEREWLEDRNFIMAIFIIGIMGSIMVGAFLFASATSGPMSTGFVCFSFLTLMIMDRKTKELRIRHKIIASIAASGILLAMIGMTGIVRVKSVYRDAPLSWLNTRLEQGPGKGLFTTAEHAKWYNACMDVIDVLNEAESKTDGEATIIVSKQAPWIYTGLNIQNGAPTAWTCEINDPRLEEYYRMHDIKSLKYVLILREELGGYIGAGNPEGSFQTPNKNEISGWLGDLLECEYSAEVLECGTLYVRNQR